MSATSDLRDVLRRQSVGSQAELTVEATMASMAIRAVRSNPEVPPDSNHTTSPPQPIPTRLRSAGMLRLPTHHHFRTSVARLKLVDGLCGAGFRRRSWSIRRGGSGRSIRCFDGADELLDRGERSASVSINIGCIPSTK